MKKSYDIVMFGHKHIPSREGGVEVVVEELASRMVALGHSVTCFNRKGNHVSGKQYNIKEKSIYKGVKIKSVFTINKKGVAAMTSSLSATILAAFGKYDIVHIHAEGNCCFIWLPKLMRKKCIVTIHGLDYKRAKWGKFASKYILFGEKMAAKYADEIIVLSEGVKKYFKEKYNRDAVFISNGIVKPQIVECNSITDKYGLYKDDYILYLGRIVPEKGIQYLIEAYQKINTEKKLVIAGGSSDSNEFMEELIKKTENNSKVIFTGFVKGRELEELYSNAYVYVLPSDLEGMPLSLLEAMSYGNCCIVSDIDECTEVVEDKAIVFKKGNILELSNCLENICENKKIRDEYKNKSSDFICNKYNWDDVVDKTLELYN